MSLKEYRMKSLAEKHEMTNEEIVETTEALKKETKGKVAKEKTK